MSDTNPLPASEFRRLADVMAARLEEFTNGDGLYLGHTDELNAYRSARAASPVTLEEALVEKISKQVPEKPDYWSECGQCDRNISDADDCMDARRLAGEGGA